MLSDVDTPTTDTTNADPGLIRTARAQRADLRKAMIDLERSLARPAPGRVAEWSDNVHEALVGLAATFERHIAVTEGDDGFLAEIAEHSPRLIKAIERVQGEHGRIRQELSSALAHVRRLSSHADDDDIATLRDHVTVLLTDLVRHRQHGADLVWEAHAVDIGGWE